MKGKTLKEVHGSFSFRLKMSDYEIELSGSYEDVQDAIKNLSELVANVSKALEKVKPKKVATLTVKTEAADTRRGPVQQYPQVSPSDNPSDAILKLLETDWGKWRPRTIDELGQALKANEMEHSKRTLNRVLAELVKKQKIRRWNTTAGFVYILVEKETLSQRGESQ